MTIADAVLAFPIAYYMARIATPRARNILVVAVLVPLWASYLVKAYAWRTILSDNGVINWALEPLGISFDGYSSVGLWLVFTYLWLPFMILPIYAGLERLQRKVEAALGHFVLQQPDQVTGDGAGVVVRGDDRGRAVDGIGDDDGCAMASAEFA